MSYNGIGLKTARGTGTNGYVRKNTSSQAERDRDGTQGKLYERRKLQEKVHNLNYKRSEAKLNVDLDKLEKEINEITNKSDNESAEVNEATGESAHSNMTTHSQNSIIMLSRDELREIELRVEEYRDKLEDAAESKGEDIEDELIEDELEKYRKTLKERKLQRLKFIEKKQKSQNSPPVAANVKPYPVELMMNKERKDQLFKESINNYKSKRDNTNERTVQNARDKSPIRKTSKLDEKSKSELEAKEFIQGFSL